MIGRLVKKYHAERLEDVRWRGHLNRGLIIIAKYKKIDDKYQLINTKVMFK